jgi:hypothetical protein
MSSTFLLMDSTFRIRLSKQPSFSPSSWFSSRAVIVERQRLSSTHILRFYDGLGILQSSISVGLADLFIRRAKVNACCFEALMADLTRKDNLNQEPKSSCHLNYTCPNLAEPIHFDAVTSGCSDVAVARELLDNVHR